MAKKDKWSTQIAGIRLNLSELEQLAALADSPFFVLLLKLQQKFHRNYSDIAFKLRENDPDFVHKHRSYAEQATGIRNFLVFISRTKEKLDKEEDNE